MGIERKNVNLVDFFLIGASITAGVEFGKRLYEVLDNFITSKIEKK